MLSSEIREKRTKKLAAEQIYCSDFTKVITAPAPFQIRKRLQINAQRTGPQQRRGASRTIGDGLKDPCHSSLSEVHHAVMLWRKLLQNPENGPATSWPDLGRRRPRRTTATRTRTAFNQESAPLRAQARNFAAEPAHKAVQRMGPFSQNRNCGEPTRKAIAELSLCPNEFTWSVGLPQH